MTWLRGGRRSEQVESEEDSVKEQKGPAAGRRAESNNGPTPGPGCEGKSARKRGGSSASVFSGPKDSESSAFRRSSVHCEVPLITKALRVEIVAPIGRTWDELGTELRRYRSAMHHIYNGTLLNVLLEQHSGKELFDLDGKARAYQMARQVAKANGIECHAGMMSDVAREVERKLKKWTKDGKRTRIPSYKLGAPIPNRANESGVIADAHGVTLKIALGSNKDGGADVIEYWFARLAPSKGSHWAKLREIADGSVKRGALKIVYDERRRKWYAIIAYSEPEPAPTKLNAANVLVVHRGQHNWLTAMSSTGKFRYLDRGNKYLAMRRSLEARRRQLKGIVESERGSGAKGHGRDRRFATYERLGDYLARFNHTKCQQLAAAVAKLCREWGCGRVFIEDHGGIQPSDDRNVRRFVDRFPLAELKTAVAWALRKDGIPLDEVSSEYISTECPRCCNVHDGQHNTRTGVFHCQACGYERPADFVAVLHMLRRSGANMSAWDKLFGIETGFASPEARGEVVREADQQKQGPAGEPGRTKKGGARKASRNPSKSRRASEGRCDA